jgi:thioesterase domain-containing protein
MKPFSKPEQQNPAPRQIRIPFAIESVAQLRAAFEQVSLERSGGTTKLPWYEHDLRALPEEAAARWFVKFLETDRKQRLNQNHLAMRCSAVLLPDNRAELIWSFHPGLIQNGGLQSTLDEIGRLCGGPVTVTEIEPPELATAQNDRGPHVPPETRKRVKNGSDAADGTQLREIERQLSAIWKAVIGRDQIGRDEDFFEAGGHSLSAARLLAHVESRMGLELSLAALLESPTIASQALLIHEAYQAREKAAAIEAHEAPPELPLFFLGGDATFQPLVKRLRAFRKVHSLGLQAALLRRLGPEPSLEQIAGDFASEVLKREPQGPVALGGWCAHGLLALETAQQLKQTGYPVGQLILLEVANPAALKVYSPWWRFVSRQQLKLHLLRFEKMYVGQLSSERAREYLRGRVNKKIDEVKSVWRRKPENSNDHGNLLELLYRAAAEYTPRPYDGQVLLVRSTERTMGFARDERLGWGNVLADLKVQRVPGNHYTIYMPPNADTLANRIHGRMEGVEQMVSGSAQLPCSEEKATIPQPAE